MPNVLCQPRKKKLAIHCVRATRFGLRKERSTKGEYVRLRLPEGKNITFEQQAEKKGKATSKSSVKARGHPKPTLGAAPDPRAYDQTALPSTSGSIVTSEKFLKLPRIGLLLTAV